MKTYKINNKNIELLDTVMLQDMRLTINEIIKALGTPEEEPVKELTIEERKAELEKGWERQENWLFMCSRGAVSWLSDHKKYSEYANKQKAIAKLNTVIDKLNKEEGWVVDGEDLNQDKYCFNYDLKRKETYKIGGGCYNRLSLLNHMSEETADFLLENYKNELKELFEVK